MYRIRGRSNVFAILMTAALATAQALPAFAAETHEFDIPSKLAPAAIDDFASQAQVQILVAGESIEDKRLNAVRGELATHEGLRLLLADSGLEPRYVGDRSIALVKADAATSSSAVRSRRRLAQASTASSSQAAAPAADSIVSREAAVEEIIVTAQKRGEERLQEVPIPITVLDGDSLAETGKVMLRDYVSTVPGLSIRPGTYSTQLLSIRGITTGSSIPTVAIMVDGVPFGSSTNFGGPYLPEIDPGDLERIEVLRGPQGTLYGSNSMGGLLSFVTKKPSLDGYGGRIEASTATVSNGDHLGYGLRASMNAPISDSFAVRLSGFTRQDPGYLDNNFLNREGVNVNNVGGVRSSALWQIGDDTSLVLSALYQDFDGDSTSESYKRPPDSLVPGSGELQQDFIAGAGRNAAITQAYSATFQTAFAGLDLTSVTAYNESKTEAFLDYTTVNGAAAQTLFGVAGAQIRQRTHAGKLVQELRLAGQAGAKIDWLVAGYYTDEDIPTFDSDIIATNANTGALAGFLSTMHQPTAYREYAAFGNITYHITDRFDVQVGGRYSDIEQTKDGVFTGGPLASPPSPPSVFADKVFSYLVTPRFRVSDDLMVYLRVASGYRPGSTNSVASVLDGAPPQFVPDETKNYEIGVKGGWLEGRVIADLSIYHIDWSKIHINLIAGNVGYTSNAGAADSDGIELALTTYPLEDLKVSGWVSYQLAELSEDFPPLCVTGGPRPCSNAYGVDGNRLVNSPRLSGHLSVEQRFPIGFAAGFVGGEVTYTGDRLGPFRGVTPAGAPLPRTSFPSYTTVDLRAGVSFDEGWTVSSYVKNLTESEGRLLGGVEAFPANTYQYIPPRTIGVSVSKTF